MREADEGSRRGKRSCEADEGMRTGGRTEPTAECSLMPAREENKTVGRETCAKVRDPGGDGRRKTGKTNKRHTFVRFYGAFFD